MLMYNSTFQGVPATRVWNLGYLAEMMGEDTDETAAKAMRDLLIAINRLYWRSDDNGGELYEVDDETWDRLLTEAVASQPSEDVKMELDEIKTWLRSTEDAALDWRVEGESLDRVVVNKTPTGYNGEVELRVQHIRWAITEIERLQKTGGIIPDDSIEMLWSCNDNGETVKVSPTFYEEKGTPICPTCWEDMDYVLTKYK